MIEFPPSFVLDYSPPGSGKTRRALNWLMGHREGVLVVAGPEDREQIIRMATRGEVITGNYLVSLRKQIITAREVKNHALYGRLNGKLVYIDDVDRVLQYLFGYQLVGASFTKGRGET